MSKVLGKSGHGFSIIESILFDLVIEIVSFKSRSTVRCAALAKLEKTPPTTRVMLSKSSSIVNSVLL